MFLELWFLHADDVALVSQLQATLERDPVAGQVVLRALDADGRLELTAQPLMIGRSAHLSFSAGRQIPREVPDGEGVQVVYDMNGIAFDGTWDDDRMDLVITLDLADGVSPPRHLTTSASVVVGKVGVVLPGGDMVVLVRPTEADPRDLGEARGALGHELASLPKRARVDRIEELLDAPDLAELRAVAPLLDE